MTREIVTSPDGQWVALRDGRTATMFGPRTSPATASSSLEFDSDDVELACVNGPPTLFVAIARSGDATRVSLFVPTEAKPVARLELGAPARIAASGGGRVALVTDDRKEMTLVRAAGRGLAPHPVELGEGTVDFAVALERNQLVIGQPRRLEVWDAVACRPLRRLGLELPLPPRLVGAAAGHLWVVRPGTDEVIVYRLSDGRPFRHYVGAPIDDVVANLGSPIIVLVTRRGLVRLHCFAHSLLAVESPWQAAEPMALLVNGDKIVLLGWAAGATDPWWVSIGGSTFGVAEPIAQATTSALATATAGETPRQTRGVQPVAAPAAATPAPAITVAVDGSWRDALAKLASRALAGDVVEQLPAPPAPIVALANQLSLDAPAIDALVMLYAAHLVGEPAIAIARLAKLVGNWNEALGTGQLAALAMIERERGTVALATAATDLLDGAPPRHVRIVGAGEPVVPRAGAWRVNRDRRSDAEVEAALIGTLDRIAIVESGALGHALLEARLYGATAVTPVLPDERPRPWPVGAGLVVVVEHGRTASAWIADVPPL